MAVIEQERVCEPEKLAEPDEVLLKAANLLRGRWGQKQQFGETGKLCVFLAIHEAALGDSLDPSLKLGRSLGIGEDYLQLFAWNDTPGRTEEEVIEALERAAWLSS